jgi:predicted peptidase
MMPAMGARFGVQVCTPYAERELHPMTASQTQKAFAGTVTKKVACRYLLFLPKGYPRGRKRWPLILFLHGAGERGRNLELVKKHGPPKIVEEREDSPFILVSPQCPRGETWKSDVLDALLDEVIASCRVDPRRVYLTGLSMGGYGTWSLACDHPERFAAIAPVCGGGRRIEAHKLKDTPVWAFHGARDDIVPVAESERMVTALEECGGNAKLTVYPDAGHDSWTETYSNPALYKWFLRHRRPKARRTPARRRPCRSTPRSSSRPASSQPKA